MKELQSNWTPPWKCSHSDQTNIQRNFRWQKWPQYKTSVSVWIQIKISNKIIKCWMTPLKCGHKYNFSQLVDKCNFLLLMMSPTYLHEIHENKCDIVTDCLYWKLCKKNYKNHLFSYNCRVLCSAPFIWVPIIPGNLDILESPPARESHFKLKSEEHSGIHPPPSLIGLKD